MNDKKKYDHCNKCNAYLKNLWDQWFITTESAIMVYCEKCFDKKRKKININSLGLLSFL